MCNPKRQERVRNFIARLGTCPRRNPRTLKYELSRFRSDGRGLPWCLGAATGVLCARPARARARTAGRARPRGAARGPRKNGTWEFAIGQESEPPTAGARGEAELARQTVHMGLM